MSLILEIIGGATVIVLVVAGLLWLLLSGLKPGDMP